MYLVSGIAEIKRKRCCGSRDACSKDNCGHCTNCKDMKKFGGTGKKKQCCVQRQCKVSEVSRIVSYLKLCNYNIKGIMHHK